MYLSAHHRSCIEVLLAIILLLRFTENVNLDVQFTMVEYFSGKGNVAGVFKKDPNHRVATFELEDSRSMDMNSNAGFALLAKSFFTKDLWILHYISIYIVDLFDSYGLTQVSSLAGYPELSWCSPSLGSSLWILDPHIQRNISPVLHQQLRGFDL